MGTNFYQEVTGMKLTGKITKTICAAAIFAMFAVPAMASTAPQGDLMAGKGIGMGTFTADNVLLARGGNGNGGGDKGGGGGNGDRDGSGSGDRDRDQDKDRDQDQDRATTKDGSCQA